ncbi:hypothetical protein MCAP1_002597 [Malassezia caprae]|uniref:THO complex subunit 1 n=1 Tax=Malassezia caprae TaxID=1381934 RepID=A0AAF0E7A0_9BASI|nr:hypothetical protein MCAP1_002597 [Malassezia caprae]
MREQIARVSHALRDSWARMSAALHDTKREKGVVRLDADVAYACVAPAAEHLRQLCTEAQQTWAGSEAAALCDEALSMEIWAHVHTSVLASADIEEAVDRLDMAVALSQQGLGDPTLPLSALADLFEQTPIQQCMDLFSYAESRAALLTQDLVPTAGKGLVFLRMCNELQRRLSVVHEEHATLAGRILLLLSTTLPLHERSGVNLKGESNTAHAAELEALDEQVEPLAAGAAPSALAEHPALYELFWSLQHYMANPAALLAPGTGAPLPGAAPAQHLHRLPEVENGAALTPMQVFQAGVQCMLDVLNAVPATPAPVTRPAKRARTDAHPAYLSARRVFSYELQDPLFRRQFLVQCLVVFQYLLGQSRASRERAKDWTNKLILQTNELTESEEQWTRKTWRQVQNLLRDSGPDGRAILDIVLNVLRRESAWVQWKGVGAPSTQRAPLDAETYAAWQGRVAATLARPAPAPLVPMGSAELRRLWEEGLHVPAPSSVQVQTEEGEVKTLHTDGLEDLEGPGGTPSLVSMDRQMKRHAGDDDEALAKREGLAWRALRCVDPAHLHLMACMRAPDDVDGLLQAMQAEAQGEAYEPPTMGEEPEEESEPEPEEAEAKEPEAKEPEAKEPEAEEPEAEEPEAEEPEAEDTEPDAKAPEAKDTEPQADAAHEPETTPQATHEAMQVDEPDSAPPHLPDHDARSSSLSSSSSSPLSTSEDDADPDSTFLTAPAADPRSPG